MKRAPRVVHEVRECLRTFVRVPGPGVVAVSGGADSVALLRALSEAGCTSLTVAHVNHQLRGAESDGDEAFVKALADSLGIAFRAERVDVAAEASGENLEATARRLRYGWLAEVAADVGARWIATGHTADDQAETVLHRLVRGTGLRGLRGVARWDELRSNVEIVRPLLTVTRAELLDYLSALGQAFRTDSSNADPRFTRNRIRADLVPLLKTFNPDVVGALNRLARQADEASVLLARAAGVGLTSAELPRAGELCVFDALILIPLGGYLIGEAFRLLWEREGWPTGEMSADHWGRVAEVVRGERTAAEFPGGVTARRAGRVVQVGRS